ncbi:hypothetical protein JB92DRAFT_2834488 [Gautieria morchelliformis]|nr:hypothetical protein JB92DRAFT_2834488 [Gautieria morchelliformis]
MSQACFHVDANIRATTSSRKLVLCQCHDCRRHPDHGLLGCMITAQQKRLHESSDGLQGVGTRHGSTRIVQPLPWRGRGALINIPFTRQRPELDSSASGVPAPVSDLPDSPMIDGPDSDNDQDWIDVPWSGIVVDSSGYHSEAAPPGCEEEMDLNVDQVPALLNQDSLDNDDVSQPDALHLVFSGEANEHSGDQNEDHIWLYESDPIAPDHS